VECIVCAGVLVPLLAWSAQLGKVGVLKHQVMLASRALAWENTVSRKPVDNDTLLKRFIDYPHLPIGRIQPLVGIGDHRFWRRQQSLSGDSSPGDSNSGDSRTKFTFDPPLSIHTGDNAIATAEMTLPKAAHSMAELLRKTASVNGNLSTTEWGLAVDGLLRAEVNVDLSNNRYLVTQGRSCQQNSRAVQFACVSAGTALVTDNWSAGSREQSENRSRSFVPAAQLAAVGNTLAVIGKLPLFGELSGLQDAFGRVDGSVLPPIQDERQKSKPVP